MKKTTKRLFWVAACALGLVAASTAPALAGAMINHSEPLTGR